MYGISDTLMYTMYTLTYFDDVAVAVMICVFFSRRSEAVVAWHRVSEGQQPMPEILFERLAGRLRVEKDVESCWGEEAARATLQDMKIRMARKKESEARQLYHDWDIMTRLLLHFGADPEQKDSQGHTALDYVKSKVLREHFSFRFTGGKSTRAPFEVYPICEA